MNYEKYTQIDDHFNRLLKTFTYKQVYLIKRNGSYSTEIGCSLNMWEYLKIYIFIQSFKSIHKK